MVWKQVKPLLFFCEAYTTKVSRNANMAKLQAGYLFPEVCDGIFSYLLCCYAIVVDVDL